MSKTVENPEETVDSAEDNLQQLNAGNFKDA
jgi:hypothetical protein